VKYILLVKKQKVNNAIFGGDKQEYRLQKQCTKVDLTNGFVPIKELIYDIRSLRNYETYIKMKANGIRGLGIQTDYIIFDENTTVLRTAGLRTSNTQ
jgi:hypothetical protein